MNVKKNGNGRHKIIIADIKASLQNSVSPVTYEHAEPKLKLTYCAIKFRRNFWNVKLKIKYPSQQKIYKLEIKRNRLIGDHQLQMLFHYLKLVIYRSKTGKNYVLRGLLLYISEGALGDRAKALFLSTIGKNVREFCVKGRNTPRKKNPGGHHSGT